MRDLPRHGRALVEALDEIARLIVKVQGPHFGPALDAWRRFVESKLPIHFPDLDPTGPWPAHLTIERERKRLEATCAYFAGIELYDAVDAGEVEVLYRDRTGMECRLAPGAWAKARLNFRAGLGFFADYYDPHDLLRGRHFRWADAADRPAPIPDSAVVLYIETQALNVYLKALAARLATHPGVCFERLAYFAGEDRKTTMEDDLSIPNPYRPEVVHETPAMRDVGEAPNASRPVVSEKALRTWARNYVEARRADEHPPRSDDRLKDAVKAFPDHTVARKRVRDAIAEQDPPPIWSQRGRRPQKRADD